MTNDGQHGDQPEFRVEDEADLLFGRANPNPTREGCPDQEVLKALARRERSMDDPGYEHLAKCSPCFREMRAFQQAAAAQQAGDRRRRLIAYAAAAVLVIAVAGSWFILQRREGPSTLGQPAAVEQSARLDLRPFAVIRSDGRAAEPEGLMLPRGRLNVTILLPVGSQPGEYEIQILDAELQARASARGTAEIRDSVTTLVASLDLNPLVPGAFQLAVRRQGADWRVFPAQVR